LAALYRRRWEIETHFAELKTTMKMDVLRCETVAGVRKKPAMYALVYNRVRLVMLRAARGQGTEVSRISFIDALRWLAEARCVIQELELVENPVRRPRLEPRVRKRRPKSYPLMTKTRRQLREELLLQRVRA